MTLNRQDSGKGVLANRDAKNLSRRFQTYPHIGYRPPALNGRTLKSGAPQEGSRACNRRLGVGFHPCKIWRLGDTWWSTGHGSRPKRFWHGPAMIVARRATRVPRGFGGTESWVSRERDAAENDLPEQNDSPAHKRWAYNHPGTKV